MFKLLFSLCLLLLMNVAESTVKHKWTEPAIAQLLHQAQSIQDPGDKVDFISGYFLNTRYQAHTLIGNTSTPEQLTVRLDAVDCLTYLEYVEALRRSNTLSAFLNNLKTVRYQNGLVNFSTRKHFFSNWLDQPSAIEDVTLSVGAGASLKAQKRLNDAHPKPLIPGISAIEKNVYYIPSNKIDNAILSRLKTGDYIGIYTDQAGLDVTHVGIVIKTASSVYFRHADADAPNRKVVDTEFLRFFKHQRGIVIFRPL